jgi:hypothetical protein
LQIVCHFGNRVADRGATPQRVLTTHAPIYVRGSGRSDNMYMILLLISMLRATSTLVRIRRPPSLEDLPAQSCCGNCLASICWWSARSPSSCSTAPGDPAPRAPTKRRLIALRSFVPAAQT